MQYDLDGIKEVAIDWLNLPITQEMVGSYGILNHPIFDNIFLMDDIGAFNVIDEPERLNVVVQQREKDILRRNTFDSIIMFIRKAFRIYFLLEIYERGYADEECCGTELGKIWSLLENNDTVDAETKETMLMWLKAADKHSFMDEKEFEVYTKLPNKVTVYRGVQQNEEPIGFSWSLKREVAEWFANRFNQNGAVCQLEVDKKDIIAYIGKRNEFEVIVDYMAITEPTIIN